MDNDAQMENVRAIAGGVKNLIADRMYENRKKQFFSEMGEGQVEGINAQIKANEERIAEIDAEIAELEAE